MSNVMENLHSNGDEPQSGSAIMNELHELFREPPPNIIQDVSEHDEMHWEHQAEFYFKVGPQALRCIKLALLAAGKRNVDTILDLPCGHGRVLRTLKAAFPRARLTACDLNRDGVDFCAQVFGATPMYSRQDPEEIQFDETFDLIWVGSLLTHFDAPRRRPWLRLYASLLRPGGIVVFSTHGRTAAERLQTGNHKFMLTQPMIDRILAGYQQTGFGYHDHSDGGNWGFSLALPSWVCQQIEATPGLRILNYVEKGWSFHDAVACIRPRLPGDRAQSASELTGARP